MVSYEELAEELVLAHLAWKLSFAFSSVLFPINAKDKQEATFYSVGRSYPKLTLVLFPILSIDVPAHPSQCLCCDQQKEPKQSTRLLL